jgi:valyl-tRNA synthetase
LLATYPADAIRYWTAQGSLGHDTPFSDNQIKIGLRLITKLWNAFLFIKEHIQAADTNTPPAELGVLNEWLLHEASKTFANYNRYYEQYEAGLALMQAEQFFWSMFCDNYIELVKNQLFNPQLYSEKEVAATRWTLHQVGLRILQWYAPYVPHITESIYLELYKAGVKKDSLHQTRFLEHQQMFEFEESAQLAQQITTIAGQARKLKTEKQLSLKVPLATLTIASTNAHLLDKLKAHEQLIFGVTHAQKISYVCEARNSGIESAGVEKVGEVEQELWHAVISLDAQSNSDKN